MRTAIVTGASSGFGLLTTIMLAKQGFHVVATYRSDDKMKYIEEESEKNGVKNNVIIKKLDVTHEDSLLKFSNFIKSLDKIDVLVNNAGMAVGGFSEEVPLAAFRAQFETNVFGAIAVTQIVLPYMRAQKAGHIINVSSVSGTVGFPGLSPYVSSKHALEGWSESLRLEVASFGINVVLIEPGSYKTSIWTTGRYVPEEAQKETSPYAPMMKKIERILDKSASSFGDPSEVAKLITDIATKNQRTKLRYPVGKGIAQTVWIKKILPWSLWERIVRKQMG
ncbi:SDR family oxidoreductase [Bacillus sp. HMF5848]|uniref:SDR family oxidoreductase n=1 Tax=Bacillus sp. HMF5848 TaxID=2495421 RepID=UPI0026A95897